MENPIELLLYIYKIYLHDYIFYSNYTNFDSLCYELCNVNKWEWNIERWLSNYTGNNKYIILKSITNSIYYIIEFERIDLINPEETIVSSRNAPSMPWYQQIILEKKSQYYGPLIKSVMPFIIPDQYKWLIPVINFISNRYLFGVVRSSMNFISGIYSRIFAIGAYTTYDGTFIEKCKDSLTNLMKETSTPLLEAAKVEETAIIVQNVSETAHNISPVLGTGTDVVLGIGSFVSVAATAAIKLIKEDLTDPQYGTIADIIAQHGDLLFLGTFVLATPVLIYLSFKYLNKDNNTLDNTKLNNDKSSEPLDDLN